MKTKTTKEQKRLVDGLNAIIHSENLYHCQSGSRCVNAHFAADGVILVDNLQSGTSRVYRDGDFKNGYGTVIRLQPLTLKVGAL